VSYDDVDAVDWASTASVAFTPRPGTDPAAVCRDVLAGAPGPVRLFLSLGWGVLLLELRRRDPDRVLGWAVAASGPDSLVLRASSRWGLVSTLTFTCRDDTLSFATAIRFRNRLGRAIWWPAAPIHRLSVPLLLRWAARRNGECPA